METAQIYANKNLRRVEFKSFAGISSDRFDVAECIDLCDDNRDEITHDNSLEAPGEKPIDTEEKDAVVIKLNISKLRDYELSNQRRPHVFVW